MKQELTVNKDSREVSARFADAIHLARLSRDMSLKELAEISKSSASYINRLEKGEKRNPTLLIVFSLAKALNINVWQLISLAVNDEINPPDITDVILYGTYSIDGLTVDNSDVRRALQNVLSTIVYQLKDEIEPNDLRVLVESVEKFHYEKHKCMNLSSCCL